MLGDPIPLRSCQGHCSGLTPDDLEKVIVVSRLRNYLHFLSINEMASAKRKGVFETCFIRVIWSEDDLLPSFPKKTDLPSHVKKEVQALEGNLPHVYIFIIPLGNCLYRIKIDDSAILGHNWEPKVESKKGKSSVTLQRKVPCTVSNINIFSVVLRRQDSSCNRRKYPYSWTSHG